MRSRFLKVAAAVAACVVLASFALDFWFRSHPDSVRASLEKLLGVPVTFQASGFNFREGIFVRGVEVDGTPYPQLSSKITVRRASFMPKLVLSPRPHWEISRIRIHSPSFQLKARAQEILSLNQMLAAMPQGPKIELNDGAVSLVSTDARQPWSQEFRNIKIRAGRGIFIDHKLEIQGFVADNPDARFVIQAYLKKRQGEVHNAKLYFNFHRFSGAYLKPHLPQAVDLPDEKLTGFIDFRIQRNGNIKARGAFQVPRLPGDSWTSKAWDFFSRVRFHIRGKKIAGIYALRQIHIRSSSIAVEGSGRLGRDFMPQSVRLVSKKIPLSQFDKLTAPFKARSGAARLELNVLGSPKGLYPELSVELDNASIEDTKRHFVLDKMSGTLSLSPKGFYTDELWFFLNDTPLALKTRIVDFANPRIKARVSTYPGLLPSLRAKNPFNATFYLSAQGAGDDWRGNASAAHTIFERGQHEPSYQTAVVEKFRIGKKEAGDFISRKADRILAEAEAFRWKHVQPVRRREIVIHRPLATLKTGEKQHVFRLRRGEFAGGRLALQLTTPPGQFDSKSYRLKGHLDRADASLLMRLSKYFPPITGRFSSFFSWNGRRAAGRFRILQGVIGPLPMLDEIADSTSVESLRRVAFDSVAGMVRAEGPLWDVRMKLFNPQIRITSEMKLDSDTSRMAGTVYSSFAKELLLQSPKLKSLNQFLGTAAFLDFNFKAAGSLESPRIQWLDSDFKRNLEARIPWFFHQRADEEIERLVARKKEA